MKKHGNKTDTAPGLSRGLLVAIVAVLIVLADQILKFWVKTHFYLGESLVITDWWELKFIENNGMAFGIELWSKVLLTLGRIAAVVFFIWALYRLCRQSSLKTGFLIALAMITAGAAGNIFDCVFYGKIFNDPMPTAVASLFAPGGGYAGWFEGKVVDMLYFPICSFVWPEWMPVVGGKEFEFFQYIFNIADASICVGVALLLLFFSADASKALEMLGLQKSAAEKAKK